MLVTTSCKVFASEISIARIIYLRTSVGINNGRRPERLGYYPSGSLISLIRLLKSVKISNTPNVVEYRQGGLLDVTSQKIGDEIVVFLATPNPFLHPKARLFFGRY